MGTALYFFNRNPHPLKAQTARQQQTNRLSSSHINDDFANNRMSGWGKISRQPYLPFMHQSGKNGVVSDFSFLKHGFKGSLPHNPFTRDPTYQTSKQHELIAATNQDETTLKKIYKSNLLSQLAIYAASSSKAQRDATPKDSGSDSTIPTFGMVTEYGCWCLPSQHNDFLTGHGHPVDGIDKACRDRSRCTKCAISDAREVDCSATTGYKFQSIIENDRNLITCDENPVGSCARHLCECDADFVYNINIHFRDWDRRYSSALDNFDRNQICYRHSDSLSSTSSTSGSAPVSSSISSVSQAGAVPAQPVNAAPIPPHPPVVPDLPPADTTQEDDMWDWAVSDTWSDTSSNDVFDDSAFFEDFENLFQQPVAVAHETLPLDSIAAPIVSSNPITSGNPPADYSYNPNTYWDIQSGKWLEVQENDEIYQYIYDDPAEMVGDEVLASARFVTAKEVSALNTLDYNDPTVDRSGSNTAGIIRTGFGFNHNGGFVENLVPASVISDAVSAVYNTDYTNPAAVAASAPPPAPKPAVPVSTNESTGSVAPVAPVVSVPQVQDVDTLYDDTPLDRPQETCCGVYPKRFPYVQSANLACCVLGTYNPIYKQCLDGKVVDN